MVELVVDSELRSGVFMCLHGVAGAGRATGEG